MRYKDIIAEAVGQEDQAIIDIGGRKFIVRWTLAKDAENRRKHGLSLRDGIPVIANPLNQSELQFENGEERERIIGHATGNAVLVVVFHTEDDEHTNQTMPIIRLISVRAAERSERRRMQMQEDVKPNEAPKAIDPDNPPLTGKEVWRPWGERVQEIIKKHDAKVAARKANRTAAE